MFGILIGLTMALPPEYHIEFGKPERSQDIEQLRLIIRCEDLGIFTCYQRSIILKDLDRAKRQCFVPIRAHK